MEWDACVELKKESLEGEIILAVKIRKSNNGLNLESYPGLKIGRNEENMQLKSLEKSRLYSRDDSLCSLTLNVGDKRTKK